MKKAFIIVLTVFVLAAVFISCNKPNPGEFTIIDGVLQVGLEIGYPPMEYFDDDGITPIGFDVEMSYALGEKLGMEVKLVNTAWDGIFAGIDAMKYDAVISSVTITDARLEAHNFSKPYIQNTLAILLPSDSTLNISSPMDLAGLGVAYQDETTSDFYMQNLGISYTPFEYEKVLSCFDEMKLGRIDVIITDLLVAYEYLSNPNYDVKIVWQGAEEEFGICMKKGNDKLTDAINFALDELFEEGTMLEISNNVFGMDLVSAVR
jgi:polar amino acid transport system substrate-binding protein